MLSSIRVIFCRSAIFVAYVDAPFRSRLRKQFQHADSREFERLSANAQKDDALDPYDFAILIALAQDQKFGGVKPDGGVYTVHDLRPKILQPSDFLYRLVEGVLSELFLSSDDLPHGSSPGGNSHCP